MGRSKNIFILDINDILITFIKLLIKIFVFQGRKLIEQNKMKKED